MTLYPGGISRTCTQCCTAWLTRRPQKDTDGDTMVIPEIVEEVAGNRFIALDCDAGTLDYHGQVLMLSREWIRGTVRRRTIRRENLQDLARAVHQRDREESKRLLSLALDPQPRWGIFFCHQCGLNDQSDILAATNLAHRAIALMQRGRVVPSS